MTVNFDEIQKKAKAEWEALEQSGKSHIIVGTATCGQAAGALAVIEAINAELTKHNIEAIVTQVGCIGVCYVEPLVEIGKPNRPHICYGNVTPEMVPQLIEDYIINDNPHPELALGIIGDGNIDSIPKFWELPMLKPQVRIALRNCGIIDPDKIDHYIARGGYNGLSNTLKMTPQEVIEEIKKSGLRGRGGAGFPTGMKWQFCHDAPGTPKYLICNADEGDPGAFMDRSLLESDPHSVLEGIIIGAYAMGATTGYIYCRAEYPLAIDRLKLALQQMEEYGLLGDNILGSDFSFHIKIKEGAGAFVCGEETALIASIEGKRGMPKPRPPFPAQSGLWGKPTNINNVETWANVSAILQHGGDWYASYGTEKSKGTKTFALAGKINHTGLIEVPMGIPLREIIYGIGGGIPDDKEFKAVQTGGPSGGCLPASMLDLPVEYESLAQAGAIMGSGGMVVMDEETCMVDVARYFLSFTQSESCGKCVPCRVGTKQMLDTLEKMTRGTGKPEEIDSLLELGKSIKDGSLCGLGQTAPNPVLTTERYFREEYEAHTHAGKCPALACTDLIRFYILPDKCMACGICLRECPAEAISGGKRLVHVIDQSKCTKCGTCLDVCPSRFGAVLKVSGEKVDVPSEPIPVTAAKPAAAAGKPSENE
ncbi:NADH-quinone oxidoreductase subunit NuoF [Chloroflexota bacterium]